MAEVILICGKICSGKSTWAKALCRESGALCLSVDELMLALLPERLGDLHDEVAARAQGYLLRQAARIARVRSGEGGAYFVDERLLRKMEARFEPPGAEETDRVLRGEIPGSI